MTDSPMLTLAAGNPITAEQAREWADQMARTAHDSIAAEVAAWDRGDVASRLWTVEDRNTAEGVVGLLALYLAPEHSDLRRGPYWLHRAAAAQPPGPRCEVLHEAAVYVRMAERAEQAQRNSAFARTDQKEETA